MIHMKTDKQIKTKTRKIIDIHNSKDKGDQSVNNRKYELTYP